MMSSHEDMANPVTVDGAIAVPPTADDAPPETLFRSQDLVRVRLLVAIPVIIVLLLTTMAGLLYQVVEWQFGSRPATAGAANIDMSRLATLWLYILFAFDVIGALAGYIVARSISRPVSEIVRASRRIATGDFSTKAPVQSRDEMGMLGVTFNAMVDSLNRFFSSRNRFILESFTGGLITTDLNGTITAINSAAEAMLGVEQARAQGRTVARVCDRPGLAEFVAVVEEMLWHREQKLSRGITIHTADGQPVSVSVRFTMMRDSAGKVFGLIINLRDLSELRKFYDQMSRADRLATVGTFATGLAHEVRNPLGAIKTTAQLLAEDLSHDARLTAFTQVIVDETNRLDKLVREVQELSHTAGPMTPHDLNAIVRESVAVAHNSNDAAKPGVTLDESYADDMPPVPVSSDKLRQALLNVLINAFQASPPGGAVRVRTAVRAGEPMPAVVTIWNSGPAIPPDVLQKVFEPFFTTKDHGTGLGLAIAAQIIRHHDGEIQLVNTDGGVETTIRLPLEADETGLAN